jgi:arylsulfatase A
METRRGREMMKCFSYILIAVMAGFSAFAAKNAVKPNILILYADDMGFGDLGCQNPDSKIPTPNLDRLAAEGMRFTDGHSSSGVCTPSRYAMLTGRYHWRKFYGIVGALGQSVFSQAELTLPEMLRDNGYTTAAIGKWHLGWDWASYRLPEAKPTMGKTSWGKEVKIWGPECLTGWSMCRTP